MSVHGPVRDGDRQDDVMLHGVRYSKGPQESAHGSIQIARGRIACLLDRGSHSPAGKWQCAEIDLSGFFILPGLINAHDHLDFALFPRLADPPYRNYIDWGEDIHKKFPEIIAMHRAAPKEVRVWWGGIRNLLCGVTTVSHHNPLWPELQRNDFPVRVVQEYGWAHSLALGGDVRALRAATPDGRPFIVHACEGVDERARRELWELDDLKLLDASTVLVHGLAIDAAGIVLLRKRKASLIVCPSSNNFLFGELPNLQILGGLKNIALGSDSPLTAEGDLLDEIRFAVRACGISHGTVYRMVTESPAAILRLKNGEGAITVSCVGDLIAVRDTGQGAAERLPTLSTADIEFVTIGGRVQLASDAVLERLPPSVKRGLEPLSIGGTVRWLRAPVKELLARAEEVLGAGGVQLGGRRVRLPMPIAEKFPHIAATG